MSANPKIQFTSEQLAIFEEMATGDCPIVRIDAYAGSGKTSTMMEGIVQTKHRYARIIMVCFNKPVATELSEKLAKLGLDKRQAKGQTFHSVGMGALAKRFGKIKVNTKKELEIAKTIADEQFPILKAQFKNVKYGQISKAIRLSLGHACNMAMRPGSVRLPDMSWQLIDNENGITQEWLIEQIEKAMKLSIYLFETQKIISYNDMIWLPVIKKVYPWSYDLVIIDESQDLNPCQVWLAACLRKKSGRTFFVGDDYQSIYGWRGATEAMENLETLLCKFAKISEPKRLKLSKTFRCGAEIVDLVAKEWVPDFNVGTERRAKIEKLHVAGNAMLMEKVEAGDFIIARKNRPLVSLFLSYMNAGIPATLRGYNFKSRLSELNGELRRRGLDPEEFSSMQIAEVSAQVKDDGMRDELIDEIQSTCDAYVNLFGTSFEDDEEYFNRKLDEIFGDDSVRDDRVMLMSAHRSKGLEANRCFVIESSFGEMSGEEGNCLYVSWTRAKTYLGRVYFPSDD